MANQAIHRKIKQLVRQAWELAKLNGLEKEVRAELSKPKLFDPDYLSSLQIRVPSAILYLVFILENWDHDNTDNPNTESLEHTDNDNDTWEMLCDSYTLLGVVTSLVSNGGKNIDFRKEIEKEILSKRGREFVQLKLKIDAKQKEKLFIKDCWNEWQKDGARYKSKAAFARDMLSKCEKLTSQKKIEDWCREWSKSVI